MGQLSEEGIAKKIAEQISVIAFKAPRLLRMEKEFTLLREAALPDDIPAIFPVDFSYLVTNPADQPPGYYKSKKPSR